MPDSKMILYIDLMKLQGAHLITSTRSGRLAFTLDVEASRVIKRGGDVKGKHTPELWLCVEAVESLKMVNEQTHFVTEPLKPAELKQGLRSRLIGKARLHKKTTEQR